MVRAVSRAQPADEGAVVTKAVLRAAEQLDLPNRAVARMLGVSEASVSRMGSGSYVLRRDDKAFELALMFLRLFRSLDAVVSGDEAAARACLRHEHPVLDGTPAELIQSLPGLVNVVGYLDARRALV